MSVYDIISKEEMLGDRGDCASACNQRGERTSELLDSKALAAPLAEHLLIHPVRLLGNAGLREALEDAGAGLPRECLAEVR